MSAYSYRQHDLDGRTFARSQTVFARRLRGGRHQTRTELAAALERAGIAADGTRLALLVMRAELDAVICSGPRRGKQFTYALLEERVPQGAAMTREEALASLTRRYFASHGPATIRDFEWWSGLTMREARSGIDLAEGTLIHQMVGEHVYWSSGPAAAMPRSRLIAHLLPNYDEYLIAYKDRDAVAGRRPTTRRGGEELANHFVIDGRLAGSWQRTIGTSAVSIEVKPYERLTPAAVDALDSAVERYRRFVQTRVTVDLKSPDNHQPGY
jgi:hypothetical protein